jgi:hypothetical protein
MYKCVGGIKNLYLLPLILSRVCCDDPKKIMMHRLRQHISPALTWLFFVWLLPLSCKKKTEPLNNSLLPEITTTAPLSDFPNAAFRGQQGGLYTGGTNSRPGAHNTAGVAIAQSIQPLNTNGAIDAANGKIVWLSVGMSNTTQETQAFLQLMQSYANKNPKLVLVDGAKSGQEINTINNPNAAYWDTIVNKLVAVGLQPAQVQIIWFKVAEGAPTDTSFSCYPTALKIKYRSVIKMIKQKFPNVKLCYMSDRIYAGYATTNLNPEPFAWYTGWAVKSLMADQVSGDVNLSYSGPSAVSPWLSWGPYLWAKGAMPRSDGLTWLPADLQPDGTHPSIAGRQKVAQMLLQFFSTDETTKPWFLQ